MITYLAFLRGINVGGKKLIKMQHLAQILEDAGFKNVRTYIQSGNVIFESASADTVAIRRKAERTIEVAFGYKVTVVVKTLSDLEQLVRGDPFKAAKTEDDAMLFVVLLSEKPAKKPKLPLISNKENLAVINVTDGVAFVVARRKSDGRTGFPNGFVEKEFGVSATTRSWSSLNKILKAAAKS